MPSILITLPVVPFGLFDPEGFLFGDGLPHVPSWMVLCQPLYLMHVVFGNLGFIALGFIGVGFGTFWAFTGDIPRSTIFLIIASLTVFLSAVADLFQILVVNTSDRELAVLPIIQQSFLSISLLAKLLFIQLFCAEGPSESVPVIGAEWKEKRYVGKKRRAIDGVVGGWCIATAILSAIWRIGSLAPAPRFLPIIPIYIASQASELSLLLVFSIKLILHAFVSSTTLNQRFVPSLYPYIAPLGALSIGIGITATSILLKFFSETPVGKLLLSFELYVFSFYILIVFFRHRDSGLGVSEVKRKVENVLKTEKKTRTACRRRASRSSSFAGLGSSPLFLSAFRISDYSGPEETLASQSLLDPSSIRSTPRTDLDLEAQSHSRSASNTAREKTKSCLGFDVSIGAPGLNVLYSSKEGALRVTNGTSEGVQNERATNPASPSLLTNKTSEETIRIAPALIRSISPSLHSGLTLPYTRITPFTTRTLSSPASHKEPPSTTLLSASPIIGPASPSNTHTNTNSTISSQGIRSIDMSRFPFPPVPPSPTQSSRYSMASATDLSYRGSGWMSGSAYGIARAESGIGQLEAARESLGIVPEREEESARNLKPPRMLAAMSREERDRLRGSNDSRIEPIALSNGKDFDVTSFIAGGRESDRDIPLAAPPSASTLSSFGSYNYNAEIVHAQLLTRQTSLLSQNVLGRSTGTLPSPLPRTNQRGGKMDEPSLSFKPRLTINTSTTYSARPHGSINRPRPAPLTIRTRSSTLTVVP